MSGTAPARRLRALLDYAADDLRLARAAVELSPRNSFYLLSQAAEKIARALLEARGQRIGPTHSLDEFASLLEGADPWRQRLREFAPLSIASTRARYPGPQGQSLTLPSEAELRHWAGLVEELLRDATADIGRRSP